MALNGLSSGKNVFEGSLGREFFVEFGNSEILDADVRTVVTAEKSGGHVRVDMALDGNVTVACDRCLENLVLPISRTVLLEARFGDGREQEEEDGGRELIWLSRDDAELDLSQTAYDYVCLSLPLRRCHADGGCDPAVLKHLRGIGDDGTAAAVPGGEASGSPFASLRGLFGGE